MTIVTRFLDFFREKYPEKYPFYFVLVFSVVITISQTFIKLLSPMPTQQIILYRSVILLIFNYPQLKSLTKFDVYMVNDSRTYKIIIIRSILGGLSVSLGFMGVQILKIQEFVTLWLTSPIWSLFAVKILKIKDTQITIIKVLLILLNFCGMVLVINPNILDFNGQNVEENEKESSIYQKPEIRLLGFALTIFGSISFSFATSMVILVKGKTAPYIILQYFYFITVIISSIMIYLLGMQTENIFNFRNIFFILMVACTSYFSQLLMSAALIVRNTTDLLPFTYFQIVCSFFIDIAVFGNAANITQLIGALIIVVGCIKLIRIQD